jgi:hypothetical protein
MSHEKVRNWMQEKFVLMQEWSFWWWSDPFSCRSDPFSWWSDPFWCRSDLFWWWSDPFSCRSDPFWCRSDPFWRKWSFSSSYPKMFPHSLSFRIATSHAKIPVKHLSNVIIGHQWLSELFVSVVGCFVMNSLYVVGGCLRYILRTKPFGKYSKLAKRDPTLCNWLFP